MIRTAFLYYSRRPAFASLIGLLLALIIIGFLAHFMLTAYFGRSSASSQAVPELQPESAAPHVQYESAVGTARGIVGELNQRFRQQQEQIDGL